jgi:hypothetical protein
MGVDPNGSPQWVIIFKESPNATLVVCAPYPDLFQERVGLNLSVLVGKTLEAAGQSSRLIADRNKYQRAAFGWSKPRSGGSTD